MKDMGLWVKDILSRIPKPFKPYNQIVIQISNHINRYPAYPNILHIRINRFEYV